MNFYFLKKTFTYIVCLNFITSFVFSAYADETDIQTQTKTNEAPQYSVNIVNSNTYKIGSGVTFTKQELTDSNSNNQKAYFVEFGDDELCDIVFLSGENLNQRNKIDTLVENLKLDNGHVVAAMNADFFNMSNGVPESALIKDGVLLTSDRDNFVLAKNSAGEYFFDKPSVKISVSFDDKNYSILHFNKEFTEYGLYLYNSEYGSETYINVPATELVLFPYTDILDAYDICELYFDGNAPYDALEEIYDEDYNEYVAVINREYDQEINSFIIENNIVEINGKFYKGAGSNVKIGAEYRAVVLEKRNNTEVLSNEIMPDTFVLSAKTDTQAFKLEKTFVGMDLIITVDANEKFYDVEAAIGTGAIIVNDSKIIEHNELSHYSSPQPRTAIGLTADNRIIMYSVDGRDAQNSKGLTLKQLSSEMLRLGCVIAANLDGGGSTTVKTLSFDNGEFTTINKPSDSSERKISNAIAFYNKLQATGIPAYSYLNSKSMYVLPNSYAVLENPVYFDESFYPVKLYEKLNFTEEAITEEYAEKTDIPEKETNVSEGDIIQEFDEKFNYYVEKGKGSVKDYVYSPEGFVGKAQIFSQSIDGYENTAYEFISTDKLDKINITNDGTSIYVGDSVDFNAEGYLHNTKVFSEDYEYEWDVDSLYGTISDNGVFTAFRSGENVEILAKYNDVSGVFNVFIKELPFLDIDGHWAKKEICSIYEGGISIGELTELGRLYFPQRNFTRAEFCVMLARLLGLTVAVDTVPDDLQESNENEESEKNFEITEESVEQSETFDTEDVINIIDNASLNENDIELSNEVQSDSSTDQIINEKDTDNASDDFSELSMFYTDFEAIPEWARQSVNELYKYGLLDGYFHLNDSGEHLFDAQVPVLRSEIISLIGRILPSADENFTFELSDVSEQDLNYQSIRNVLFHGIFKGYPDKTLKLDQNLTRAEIAVVFNRLNDFEIGEYIFNNNNE